VSLGYDCQGKLAGRCRKCLMVIKIWIFVRKSGKIILKGEQQKMGREIDFVKVHAGWDETIFLYGDQVPEGKELEVGLALLKRPSLRGTEVGILYEPEKGGDIKVKILDATSNGFVSMCGGLTQSLGKAIVETDIGRHFNIKAQEPETEFVLETDAGLIPIRVDVNGGVARKVISNMRSYVEECYRYGVQRIKIGKINAISVGVSPPDRMEFLVFNVDELTKEYPDINFWRKNESVLDVLRKLYEDFIGKALEKSFLYGALYDMHPEGRGNARVIFRFLPTMYYQEKGYEEACGTGATAVGIAMLENGDLNVNNGTAEVLFEVGSKSIVSKTQQVETELKVSVNDGKVVDAEFSHSLIELIAYGKVYIST